MATFSAWDYVVFGLMLAISTSIGIYVRFSGGKQKTTNEFLHANRNMSKWMVCVSVMTSFTSAVSLLGNSAEIYQYGTLFVISNLAYFISTPIVAYVYLPVFFKLNTYLGKRFGQKARIIASAVYLLQMILYMGIVLYAPAIALEAVTGLDQTYAILILGLVCTFYSTLGGMKAIIFIDLFQTFLMFVALYSVIIIAGIEAGGLERIWDIAYDGGRIEFLNFNPDPTIRHTWWPLIIGGAITHLALNGVNQVQVQVMQTTGNIREARKTIWLNFPAACLLNLSTSFSGLAIYYSYRHCDPLLEGRISVRDQLLPLFVIDFMGHLPGLAGLVVSGIFSASLSSVAASLNSLAAVTLKDYVRPIYRKIRNDALTEAQATLATKSMACIYGFICIGISFLAHLLGGILQAVLTVFGVVGGPLLGFFSLGMFNTRPNEKGAITGLLVGLAMSVWIGFGGPKPPPKYLDFSTEACSADVYNATLFSSALVPRADDSDYFWLYRISYMWYSTIGFIVTFLVGYLASHLFERLGWDSNDKIYTDTNRTQINCDLFVPQLVGRLKRKNEEMLKIATSEQKDMSPVK